MLVRNYTIDFPGTFTCGSTWSCILDICRCTVHSCKLPLRKVILFRTFVFSKQQRNVERSARPCKPAWRWDASNFFVAVFQEVKRWQHDRVFNVFNTYTYASNYYMYICNSCVFPVKRGLSITGPAALNSCLQWILVFIRTCTGIYFTNIFLEFLVFPLPPAIGVCPNCNPGKLINVNYIKF